MTNRRIAFIGTGAQGASIAADLVRAGLDVTFIEQWPSHVDAMNARGIEVRFPTETTTTDVVAIHLCQVAELTEPFDLVFMLVKAYDTRWAAELIRPHLTPDGVVVGLQNGMSIDDLVDVLGAAHVVGAVIEMASNMFEPGVVTRQTPVSGSWFAIGALHDAARARLADVQSALGHAGTVEIVDDIRSAKWMKLVANAGELVPSAILDLPLEEAVALDGVHRFMIECGKEAARAAIADGCRLVPIFGLTDDAVTGPEQYAEDLLGEVLDKYSLPDTRTTVLQDWMKHRHSEYSEVNGLVVEVLARAGESAPFNAHTVAIAKRIEAGTLQRGRHNVDLLLAVSAANEPAAQPTA